MRYINSDNACNLGVITDGVTDVRANFLSGSVSGGQKRGVRADIHAYNASSLGVMYLVRMSVQSPGLLPLGLC